PVNCLRRVVQRQLRRDGVIPIGHGLRCFRHQNLLFVASPRSERRIAVGAHRAPARSGAGLGAPASDEPGCGAEPRLVETRTMVRIDAGCKLRASTDSDTIGDRLSLSGPSHKYGGIRPAMHPSSTPTRPPRWGPGRLAALGASPYLLDGPLSPCAFAVI